MRTRIVAVGSALLVAAVAGAGERADLKAIGEGRALYLASCARCHGAGATGLVALDLTRIATRDGSFDARHVVNHIQGRRDGMSSESMPCWGAVYARTWPRGEGAAALKAVKLARYLESVQAGASPAVVSPAPR